MNMKKIFLPLALCGFLFTSCEKDDEALQQQNLNPDNPEPETTASAELEVEEFIYSGMNEIYLYKADVHELADDFFNNDAEKTAYLGSFSSPESLFKGLKSSADKFSFITDDFYELEASFKGISSSRAGMKYGLGKISGTNNLFGFLQYIVPGTSADKKGLTRGTVFTEVDGQDLTLQNYSDLLDASSFTINIGKIEGGKIVMTDETVSLNHDTYTTNPVHLATTLDIEGKKVGYLMYTSFTGDFDDELNAAFAQFKADGINELVLDLRYNGGGSVESAVDLASMITGQFEGEIFMKEQWNKKYQDYYEAENPEGLLNRFDSKIRTKESINSLNLSKVYILTSGSTASASELVINGLEPYIDVVQVGTATTGKFQASVTLYDSPDFGREGVNENHTYAIQPLIFKSANAAGKSDYVNGLNPDVVYTETVTNLGVLGDPSEPLLMAAINHIFGKAQITQSANQKRAEENFRTVGESGMNSPEYQRMYIDKLPEILKRKDLE